MRRLSGNDDCPSKLIHAIESFNKKLTESHSRTARTNRFSIWHLVNREIEPTVAMVLGPNLFEGIAPHGLSNCAKNDSRALENRCRLIARIYSRLDKGRQKNRHIYGTLEFIISLIHFCKSCLPHTYSARSIYSEDEKNSPRLILRKNLQHFPFCELCEHLCEAEEVKVTGQEPLYEVRHTPSSRFCVIHKPGKKEYRRDHNYREAFHKKIIELRQALNRNTYTEGIDELRRLIENEGYFDEDILANSSGKKFGKNAMKEKGEFPRRPDNYPITYFEIDKNIRQIAYRFVHPNPDMTRRKSASRDSESALARLKMALTQGKSISLAAKEVGISRQAAWKALKKAGLI